MNWSYKRLLDDATIHITEDGSGHNIRVVPHDQMKARDGPVVGGLTEQQARALADEIVMSDLRRLADELVTRPLEQRPGG